MKGKLLLAGILAVTTLAYGQKPGSILKPEPFKTIEAERESRLAEARQEYKDQLNAKGAATMTTTGNLYYFDSVTVSSWNGSSWIAEELLVGDYATFPDRDKIILILSLDPNTGDTMNKVEIDYHSTTEKMESYTEFADISGTLEPVYREEYNFQNGEAVSFRILTYQGGGPLGMVYADSLELTYSGGEITDILYRVYDNSAQMWLDIMEYKDIEYDQGKERKASLRVNFGSGLEDYAVLDSLSWELDYAPLHHQIIPPVHYYHASPLREEIELISPTTAKVLMDTGGGVAPAQKLYPAYDANNRVSALMTLVYDGINWNIEDSTVIAYDGDGKYESVTQYQGSGSLQPVYRERYDRDGEGNIVLFGEDDFFGGNWEIDSEQVYDISYNSDDFPHDIIIKEYNTSTGSHDNVERIQTAAGIVGLDDAGLTADLDIYPNPASDYLTISWGEGEGLRNFTVRDITGKALNIRSQTETKSARLNVSALPAGLYLLELESDRGERTVRKFIKK